MINITREFIVDEKRENAMPKNAEDAIELSEHCRKWLVIYDGGKQEIVEADDLYDIYNKCGSDVAVAVQLNSNVVAKSYE